MALGEDLAPAGALPVGRPDGWERAIRQGTHTRLEPNVRLFTGSPDATVGRRSPFPFAVT